MATLNWSQVVEISRDEAKQSLLNLLDSVGFTATSWQQFSIPSLALEMSAEIWSRGSKVAVFLKEFALNPTSKGEALDKLSESHFDNTREQATNTRRLIELTCIATEGPYTIDVGEVVVSDEDGHTFRNIEGNSIVYPVTLSSGGNETLLFEAEVAGAASNVANGDVDQIVTTLVGVSITSDTIETEGVDKETDPRLRLRNKTKWALLTRFELIDDAVVQLVLTADPAITQVAVDSTNPRGENTFDVYIAGDLQTSGPTAVAAAQALIQRYVFGDNTALVVAAPEIELDIAGTVYYDANFSEADVIEAITGTGDTDGSLVAFLKTIPLGGFDFDPGPSLSVPVNDIEHAIKAATIGGVSCVKTVKLTTPSGDVSVGNFRKVIQGNWGSLTFAPV